jgi:hypothetical protein
MKEMGDPAYEQMFYDIAPRVNAILWNSFFVMIACLILGILAMSFFNSKSWACIKNQSMSGRHFRKMFILNLLWYFSWSALALLSLLLFSTPFAISALIILLVLFYISDFALRAVFEEEKSILENLKIFLHFFFRDFKKMLLFFLYSIILAFILLVFTGLISNVSSDFAAMILLFFLLVHMSFSRICMFIFYERFRRP